MTTGHLAFDLLKTLVGDWIGKYPSGATDKASYSLTAGDSALVEAWTLSGGNSAQTIYHMDGPHLIAAHFCPWGNFPRLRLQEFEQSSRMLFRVFDGANMENCDHQHQSAFLLNIVAIDKFERSECYISNQHFGAGENIGAMGELGVYSRSK